MVASILVIVVTLAIATALAYWVIDTLVKDYGS